MSLSSHSVLKADSRPANTFVDTTGQVLHGHNGGVWEWTATEFEGYEGHVPSKLYPGYSGDFFDGKHNVVVSATSGVLVKSCLMPDRRIVRDGPCHRGQEELQKLVPGQLPILVHWWTGGV